MLIKQIHFVIINNKLTSKNKNKESVKWDWHILNDDNCGCRHLSFTKYLLCYHEEININISEM